ncbi:MAG: GMC oxidoreductase [Pirellulaceae bacterium]|nr:GMC oxidoreductase [Pirellulaceae bacterium]
MNQRDADVIVIGSGFGGAVAACRLAQAGAKVLVLERGRRWTADTYPRAADDPWLFDIRRPQKKHGWLDIRFFPKVIVAQGAGVGGGSLCYSSVLLPPSPRIFAGGWPPEIDFRSLQPHYDLVSRMLGVRTIPEQQRTVRNQLLRAAAARSGYASRVFDTPLAINFDVDFRFDRKHPQNIDKVKAHKNPHGRWQGTCMHLGNCDIGCDVQAKNTLDLNYIASAENWGADVRPLHFVTAISTLNGGYRVDYQRIAEGNLVSASVRAPKVVLAAGSLGTTELLLRCRNQSRTLPNISRHLGTRWSPNGNVLTPAVYADPEKVQQTTGPTISAGLDFTDGLDGDGSFVVEDDGFPNVIFNALRAGSDRGWLSVTGWTWLEQVLRSKWSKAEGKNLLAGIMVWLGAGVDRGDGVLSLERSLLAPWKQSLALSWSPDSAKDVIGKILRVQAELSESTGGKLKIPRLWRWFQTMISVHPLGGCSMGATMEEAVVDHTGQVFGYPGLYVCDGAMIPKPIGLNPSLTIAAIAERNSAMLGRAG